MGMMNIKNNLGSGISYDHASQAPPTNDLYSYLNNSSGAAALLQRESFMQCKHCNRYYKSHQKLQEHVRKYCLKEKKYKCVSCEYRSRRKDHVLRHAKRKHSDLFALARDDEESFYEIRNEEENDESMMRLEDHMEIIGGDYDDDDDAAAGGDGGDAGLGGVYDASGSSIDALAAMAAAVAADGQFNFDFGSRDLTITAVPILQESDDDDDDYDDDG